VKLLLNLVLDLAHKTTRLLVVVVTVVFVAGSIGIVVISAAGAVRVVVGAAGGAIVV
jgi:hypothetical protein